MEAPKLLPERTLPEDKVTFLMIATESAKFFKSLAEYRPPLKEQRLDKHAMKRALK